MDSIIVKFWEKVFDILKHISLFNLIKRIFPKLRYKFVDYWVISNFLLSIIYIFLVKYTDRTIVLYILFFYGALRIFEILVYQINVLLFDENKAKKQNKEYALKSYRRTVILLLNNFIEIIIWYAASYGFLSSQFMNVGTESIAQLIYTSFSVMTGFGNASIEPASNFGIYLIWGESFAGLFMTLISLARFIGLLPAPKSMDDEEN